MNLVELRKFDAFYRSAKQYSSDASARRFLRLSGLDAVPLSLSHGVDFGNSFDAIDVGGVEPIHWACSPEIHARAEAIKPSLLLPHPWALETANLDIPGGAGTLLVGPPPGPANDAALYDLVKDRVDSGWSILVKPRGNYQGSLKYWAGHGVRPVVASLSTGRYFQDLAELLGQYRTVLSPTMSSVLFFAATIGREVGIIRHYTFEAFDVANYLEYANLESPAARAVVKILSDGNPADFRDISRHLLGYDMLADGRRARARYLELVESLRRPFHSDGRLHTPYFIREALARLTGKPGFLGMDWRAVSRRLRGQSVAVLRIDEFDVWLNGRNAENFSLRKPTRSETIGPLGSAAVGYPS